MGQHIVAGRIHEQWSEEFSPLFAEAMEREVAEVVKLHNERHGASLVLRNVHPEPGWLKGEEVYSLHDRLCGSTPVWIWWAEE